MDSILRLITALVLIYYVPSNALEKPTSCIDLGHHSPQKVHEEDVCLLPKEVGPCRALISSFYYNLETGKCEQFNYGGCQGNGNRFKTKEECEKKCGGKRPEFTILPYPLPGHTDQSQLPTNQQSKKVGHCRARIARYFYNAKDGNCEKFYYGGCGANENNFKTKGQCEHKCMMMHIPNAVDEINFLENTTKGLIKFSSEGVDNNERALATKTTSTLSKNVRRNVESRLKGNKGKGKKRYRGKSKRIDSPRAMMRCY